MRFNGVGTSRRARNTPFIPKGVCGRVEIRSRKWKTDCERTIFDESERWYHLCLPDHDALSGHDALQEHLTTNGPAENVKKQSRRGGR